MLNLFCCSHRTLSDRSVRDLQHKASERTLLGLSRTSSSTIDRNTSSTWNGWEGIRTAVLREGDLQIAGIGKDAFRACRSLQSSQRSIAIDTVEIGMQLHLLLHDKMHRYGTLHVRSSKYWE